MKKYFSGYVVTDHTLYPSPPYKGKGFIISFEDEPADAISHFAHSTCLAKAVIINTGSCERAQYVANMIYASDCLLDAELPPFRQTVVRPLDPDSREIGSREQGEVGRRGNILCKPALPLACMIAVKASFKKAYQYALFKHLLSHQILSIPFIELDPWYWWPNRFVSNSTEYHVRCAYAIILAYSVLEELSLDLRASREKPGKINGEWNPEVKHELESRLKQAGINLSETFTWIRRDTPTRIERVKPIRLESRAEWAGWKVRDCEIAVIDAIAHVSWLRSRISAHRLGKLAGSLNYYDVTNAQHLARRLLLETLGFWRYQEQNAKDKGAETTLTDAE